MKKLVSITEAAEILGINRTKLYELVRSQPDIPVLKIGSSKKLNTTMMEEWLDRCTKEGREL